MRIEAILAEMRSAALGRDFNEFDRLSDAVTMYVRSLAVQAIDTTWEEYGMTPHEGRILDCLARANGKPVSKQGLMDAVYYDRPDEEPDCKIIDIFICKARKKLQREGAPYWIETHWGVGYSLKQGQVPKTHGYRLSDNKRRWHKVRVAA